MRSVSRRWPAAGSKSQTAPALCFGTPALTRNPRRQPVRSEKWGAGGLSGQTT